MVIEEERQEVEVKGTELRSSPREENQKLAFNLAAIRATVIIINASGAFSESTTHTGQTHRVLHSALYRRFMTLF